MADLRVIYTDDDGDGFHDDVHVVNVMEREDSTFPTTTPSKNTVTHSTVGSTGGIFSSIPKRTRMKMFVIALIGAILYGALNVLYFFLR